MCNLFSIDTQYIYKQTKYITVVYQESHPYAGYVNYLKEFLPIIGGTLVEIDPLPPGVNAIPDPSFKILRDFSYAHDEEAIYMVILTDPTIINDIFTDLNSKSDYDFEMGFGVMESYNYNYYTLQLVDYVDYFSYYNILYNKNPSDEDLVFYKLYIFLLLIVIDMYYSKYF